MTTWCQVSYCCAHIHCSGLNNDFTLLSSELIYCYEMWILLNLLLHFFFYILNIMCLLNLLSDYVIFGRHKMFVSERKEG